MKMNPHQCLLLLLFVSLVACNNEPKSEQSSVSGPDGAESSASAEPKPSQPNRDDNSLIPYQMVAERISPEARGAYMPNTDSVASLGFMFDRKSVPSLMLQIQPQRDTAKLGRMMQAFLYNPELLQEFDAGDHALILQTKSTPNSNYTIVFRVKHHFCTIVSTNKSDASPEAGLLYNKEALMQLARDWALHLSKLES